MCQEKADLGKAVGYLQLANETCKSPHHSIRSWQAVCSSRTWVEEPTILCRPGSTRQLEEAMCKIREALRVELADSPPPPVLRLLCEDCLFSNIAAMCLGYYRLCSNLLVNGRPAWRHDAPEDNLYLAYDGLRSWFVQPRTKLGHSDGVMLICGDNHMGAGSHPLCCAGATWFVDGSNGWEPHPRISCEQPATLGLPSLAPAAVRRRGKWPTPALRLATVHERYEENADAGFTVHASERRMVSIVPCLPQTEVMPSALHAR